MPRLYIFISFCIISREAGNNVQYIWSYYSAAELKKMMDAFDAWEGKGIVQCFYFMAEGRLFLNKTKLNYSISFFEKVYFYVDPGICHVMITLRHFIYKSLNPVSC